VETIDRVETIPFSIPYGQALGTAIGTTLAADHVLVRVTDNDGVVGVAEAIPRPAIHGESVGTVMAVYEDVIRRQVLQRSIWDRERIHGDLEAVLVGNLAAKSAFDMALYDLLGRRLGVSCHVLLGGYSDSVAVTGHLTLGDIDPLVARAVEQNETYGISAFKVKVGLQLDRDIALLTRLRATLPTAMIRADANHAYTELEATRFVEATADLGLAWFEEPTSGDQVIGRERLAQLPAMHILADESTTSPATVAKEVLAGRAHAISIKVPRSGYTESDRIRIFCEMTGTEVLIGTQGETGLGTLTSLAYAAAHESTSRNPTELSTFYDLKDDLLVEPLEVKDGRIFVPTLPGNGARLDEEKLRHYAQRTADLG
jgi:L-alanine-DL-glutamate epimerase-like enolase superfamily enzyme